MPTATLSPGVQRPFSMTFATTFLRRHTLQIFPGHLQQHRYLPDARRVSLTARHRPSHAFSLALAPTPLFVILAYVPEASPTFQQILYPLSRYP